jgi:hypothetical protein
MQKNMNTQINEEVRRVETNCTNLNEIAVGFIIRKLVPFNSFAMCALSSTKRFNKVKLQPFQSLIFRL